MKSHLKREQEEVDDFVFDSDDEGVEIATLLATESLLPRHQRGKRGGSHRGRAPNLACDFDDAHAWLVADYFAVDPVYPARYFERRFRVPRELFNRVLNEVSKAPYFVRKTDAASRHGLTPPQKVCTAILMLASGACADRADRELGISDSSAMECMKIFSEESVRRFSKEYLRQPTETGLKRIMSLYASSGFLGCIGCIDCQHYQWEACPM
jgi:Plant transposon protein